MEGYLVKDPLEKYRIKEASQKILENPKELFQLLKNGKMLYDIFGFSTDVMVDFYKAATKLLSEERFEDAHDAFFFLATLAPRVSEFWRGLSFSCMQLSKFDEAIETCQKAIDTDPQSIEGYLTAIRIFCSMQDYERAHSFINETISFAKKYQSTKWTKELIEGLAEAKDYVRNEFYNDQDSNYPS